MGANFIKNKRRTIGYILKTGKYYKTNGSPHYEQGRKEMVNSRSIFTRCSRTIRNAGSEQTDVKHCCSFIMKGGLLFGEKGLSACNKLYSTVLVRTVYDS